MIEATTLDRRWQLVLDCLDCQEAPFSKGTLVGFRQRLISQHLDRRLIERTSELAAQGGTFGSRQLRAALDSSPLWGASRVEDTYNLLAPALRKAVGIIARKPGRELTVIAAEAGASLMSGASLKAALDLDWDDLAQRGQALMTILAPLEQVESWVGTSPAGSEHPPVGTSLPAAKPGLPARCRGDG